MHCVDRGYTTCTIHIITPTLKQNTGSGKKNFTEQIVEPEIEST